MQFCCVLAAAISAGSVGVAQCPLAPPFMNAAPDRGLFVDFDAVSEPVTDQHGQAAGRRAPRTAL